MRNRWKTVNLATAPLEIIDGDRGKNYPKQLDFSDSGFCLFLNANNVTQSGFEFESMQFIDEAKDQELRKGRLVRQDVVMTTRGTIGNIAYFHESIPYENMRINSGMVILRCNRELLSPRFLYHFLRSPFFVGQVNSLRSGVAQPQLPIRDIKRIEMPLPDLDEQLPVADVVSTYDDLIENNRRRMVLLEESARLLYKEWFVHLRFPGHEHIRVTNGVPEGWEASKVSSFGEVITGKTPSTKDSDNYGGDVPFIKTPDMHGNVFVIETASSLTEKGADTQAGKYIPPNSLLVSCIGTIGVVSIVSARSQFNQQINAVIPATPYFLHYCYFAFKGLKEQMEAIGGGATMGNVNKSKFEQLELLKPSMSVLREFSDFCTLIFEQIKNLSLQNIKLKVARDILLPRLMNGEITV